MLRRVMNDQEAEKIPSACWKTGGEIKLKTKACYE